MIDKNEGCCHGVPGGSPLVCQGGRALAKITEPDDVFWSRPCPLSAVDEFVVTENDYPQHVSHVHLWLCRAHFLAIEEVMGASM